MSDVLDLATYKTITGMSVTTFDAQLEALIEAANRFVEQYCNKIFGIDQFTERKNGVMDVQGKLIFSMDVLPVIGTPASVTLHYFGVTSPLSLDVTKLDILHDRGVAYFASSLQDGNNIMIRPEYKNNFYYDIVYSGGRAVPQDVTLAASLLVQNVQKYLASSTPTASGQPLGTLSDLAIGEYTEKYDSKVFAAMNQNNGLVLTESVKDILDRHKGVNLNIGP